MNRIILIVLFFTCASALAYDVRDYEEPAGLSLSFFREPGGDVYGGGFESGVWLKNTPVFGELFGHWLANRLQDGNYYSIGMTLRLMPRTAIAPFVGIGGSYNGLTSERDTSSDDLLLRREPDSRYWKAHAEVGLRIWFGPDEAHFMEAGYREHWTDAGKGFDYGWMFVEYGRYF